MTIYLVESESDRLIYATPELDEAQSKAYELNSHFGVDYYTVIEAGDLSKRFARERTIAKQNRFWTILLNHRGEINKIIAKDTPNTACRIVRDRFDSMYAYLQANNRADAIARAKYMRAHFWDDDPRRESNAYACSYDQDELNKIKAKNIAKEE